MSLNFTKPVTIAGWKHHTNMFVLDSIPANADLDLLLEPTNQYDPHAIEVYHAGQKLGYIPAQLNTVLLEAAAYITQATQTEHIIRARAEGASANIYLQIAPREEAPADPSDTL